MTSEGLEPASEGSQPSAAASESGFDLTSLLSQLGQVQQGLQDAQASAASQLVEGSAGGGMVRVTVTGGLDFEAVTIDPSVVDPTEIELLQDLILAALRDAVEQANQLQQEALGGFDPTAGLGGLEGLGGLLGGPSDA